MVILLVSCWGILLQFGKEVLYKGVPARADDEIGRGSMIVDKKVYEALNGTLVDYSGIICQAHFFLYS